MNTSSKQHLYYQNLTEGDLSFLQEALKRTDIMNEPDQLKKLVRTLSWRNAEFEVADYFKNKGYQVLQDVMLHNNSQFAQIDILAFSPNLIHLVEVKHWDGAWFANDDDAKEWDTPEKFHNKAGHPTWVKRETKRKVASPVCQVVRARDFFEDIFGEHLVNMGFHTSTLQGHVVMTRGYIIAPHKAEPTWQDWQINVSGYKDAKGKNKLNVEKATFSHHMPLDELMDAIRRHSNRATVAFVVQKTA